MATIDGLAPPSKDPDREMHEFLRREFLGIPQGKFAEPDPTVGDEDGSLAE